MGTTTSTVPMTLVSDLYPFTPAQLTEFRRVWIRDEVAGSATSGKLSAYNRATSVQFFSDDDLNSMLQIVLIDKQIELVAAYSDKYNDRIQAGDTDPLASASATAEQLAIVYRLLRADCLQRYLDDPAFQGSVPEMGRKEYFKQLGEAITRDRNWSRQRSAGYRSVEVLRK